MFGLVSKSTYDVMESRALRAEARVQEFELAAEAEAARQLAEHNKKTSRKSSKKIAVTTPDDTPATATEVDEVAPEPSVETAPSRVDVVKNLAAEGKKTSEIATQLGVSETTVRRDLKK